MIVDWSKGVGTWSRLCGLKLFKYADISKVLVNIIGILYYELNLEKKFIL